MGLLFFQAVEIAKPPVNPLISVITHRTGIVENKIRLLLRIGKVIPCRRQNSRQLLGVSGIHLTAKGSHTGFRLPSIFRLKSRHMRPAFFQIFILSRQFHLVFVRQFHFSIIFSIRRIRFPGLNARFSARREYKESASCQTENAKHSLAYLRSA